MIEFKDFELTKEQREWFADRMTETPRGVVTAPTYVLDKLRKLAGDTTIPRWKVKAYLEEKCWRK